MVGAVLGLGTGMTGMTGMTGTTGRRVSRIGSVALAAGVTWLAAAAGAQEAPQDAAPQVQLQWQPGPMTAPIGQDLAEIAIDEKYVYLDAANTQRFLELNGNPIAGTELATLAPRSEDEDWFVIFEFEESGYVPDDEKDQLDADAILGSIRSGTEASNGTRRERGWPEIKIVGWHEPPHYDARTQNLSWAIIGESAGQQNVNRITKLLGRRGVMTATLVVDVDQLDAASSASEQLLASYHYRPGSTYAEYVPGQDRLAEYGLTALVVGGAGAVLLKSGLLAKLWKPIALGLVAIGLAVKRAFFGGRRSEEHDLNRPIG